MKKKILWGSFLSLVVLSACAAPGGPSGGGASEPPEGPTGGGGSAPELQYIFELPDDPVSVSPTLDDERQVEAVIPVSGGTLSVTGADGTVYRLDIPDNALATDTLIRMIPVLSLEGMPFGGEAYAVQLEPAGLSFLDFVTLTITPAQEIPIEQQIFFGYQGAGENLTLALPVVDSREMRILLLHFSGAGVTKGFLADTEPLRAQLGGDAEARLSSAIAEQLGTERQRQLLGGEPGDGIDFSSVFQQFEELVLEPRLAAAGSSCAAARLAMQTLLGLTRQAQLLGAAPDEMDPRTTGLLETLTAVCMEEEYELCRDDHIIQNIIPAWLGAERHFQLLGGDPASPVLDQAEEYVRKCLKFELVFHSQANVEEGAGGIDSVVDSTIDIEYDTGALRFMYARAPLVNTSFVFRGDCLVTSVPGGGTFEAMNLEYSRDTRTPTDLVGYVRDLRLTYFPGGTAETFTIACPGAPPFTSPPSGFWSGIFLGLHQAESGVIDGSFSFVAEDWEILGDEYYARKEWIKVEGGIVEAGTFKLYHRPG